MLAGSAFLYLLLMGHIRHMKHEQLELKQTNVWNAYVSDTFHVPVRLAGEYEIAPVAVQADEAQGKMKADGSAGAIRADHAPGAVQADEEADSANVSWLKQTHVLNGKAFRVTTYISAKEYRHLLIKVGMAEAIIFILLLMAIIIINRRVSRKLWMPFYHTMNAIRGYDIRQNKPIALDATTGTEEFDRLNRTLLEMIDNVDQAYRNQKQFTENASHELQTPLAIIRSKVELLIEGPGLNEDNAQLLQEITEANERLSQMNKNLLLLTRIENGQYPEMGRVDVSGYLTRIVDFFEDYYAGEGVRTKRDIEAGVLLVANGALIEILLNNLLRNAYIHNVENGWVDIRLSATEFVVENSGPVLEGDPERLFDRFRKGRADSRTMGLGLALVRQITQLYRYDIRYTYQGGIHRLVVSFP